MPPPLETLEERNARYIMNALSSHLSLSLSLSVCLSVWLAVVSGVAFQHTGKAATTRGGVKLVKDGWYLSVKFYERSPATSSDTFLLDNDSEMIIDAEGVIFTSSSLALQPARAQRSRRTAPSLMRLSNAATVIAEIESALRTLSI
jgi:hypothetical protein